MSDEMMGAEVADSPAADATQADPSAGTQNTGINGQPTEASVPFHQHPRWQQMMAERNQSRQTIAELQQRLQQIDQRTQPQPSPRDPSRVQAGDALRELIAEHPELKGLLDAPKYGEEITKLNQLVQGLVQTQQRAQVTAGRAPIAEAASKHGLDAGRLERYVVGSLLDDPQALARYRAGDPSVVTEVLKDFEDNVSGKLSRPTAIATAQTKLTTRNLPPRSAVGTPPGQAAPDVFDPKTGDARSRWEQIIQKGRAFTSRNAESEAS